jgi:Cdc6-like AAA superfamily ATPase
MSEFKMPEPVVIDRNIPTNIAIRGYTADQLRQAVRDALEMAAARCDDEAESQDLFGNTQASYGADNCAAAIRTLKEQIK